VKGQQARDARAIHARYRKTGIFYLCAIVLLGLGCSASAQNPPATINPPAAQNPPPPPRFLSPPPGGTGACPYYVFLTDDQAGVSIFYTTSYNPRPAPYNSSTGIQVDRSETITAQASTLEAQSASVAGQFYCAAFTSIDLKITTGNDDARSDSAVTATLTDSNAHGTASCLKYSDNGSYSPCSQQHPGVTWQPGTTNSFEIPLPLSEAATAFNSLVIALAEFPGFGKGDDNWDLFSFVVTANSNASPGYPSSVQLLNLQPLGTPCYARFKHPQGYVSSVTFNFAGQPVIVMDTDGPHNAPYCPE